MDRPVDVTDLYHRHRLDRSAMTLKDWIIFLLYFPIGVALSVLRVSIGFFIALTTPSKVKPRIFRMLSGFICTYEETIAIPESGALLASNHSSYMDYIAISAVLKQQRSMGIVVWHGVSTFSKIIGRPVFTVYDKGANKEFLRRIRRVLSKRNLIIFPEGSITDGRTGLLAFEKATFSIGVPVYLVGLKYHRPLPFIRPKAMSAFPQWESFVELFQPWTRVELIPLGCFERQKGESAQDVTQRAEAAMAKALNLFNTTFTRHDRERILNSQ